MRFLPGFTTVALAAVAHVAVTLGYVPHAAAQRVGVRGGRVYYVPGSGAPERALTTSGRDDMPTLSPDRQLVAFVRGTPGDTIGTAEGGSERTELWVVRTDGTGARRLLRGREADDPARALAGMTAPAFSPAGRTLYVASAAWVTSGALHAVDVRTGRERFLCDANRFTVIERGPYRGHLLVWQHRYYSRGARDGVWIVTPSGRTRRRVTFDDASDAEARIAAAHAGRGP